MINSAIKGKNNNKNIGYKVACTLTIAIANNMSDM